jgi:hypothetical protein
LILLCDTKRKAADENQASLPFLTGGVAGLPRLPQPFDFLPSKHHAKRAEKFIFIIQCVITKAHKENRRIIQHGA